MQTDILRVFPHRTSYTPNDSMVRIGCQTLGLPPHKEIHISCTFTWDMNFCEYLREQYQSVTDKPVILGGPAYDSPCGEHIPGLYTREGIIFTSRGCDNNCSFCFVPKREGKLQELDVKPGNIIQDNNFLQCSQEHQKKVFDMLKSQHGICFKGGLETRLINDWFVQQLKEIRLKELWFACDTDGAIKPLEKAMQIFVENDFPVDRNKFYCYVLIGKDMEKEEERLKAVYNLGLLPFAQLYQPPERINYSEEWKRFARKWSRPAATKAYMGDIRC